VGRTLPFPELHAKRPTASLVSTKVLASIIGQIIITSAVQFWAFFWIRAQAWYGCPFVPLVSSPLNSCAGTRRP
jgi:cation-transporting ATPase 13A2